MPGLREGEGGATNYQEEGDELMAIVYRLNYSKFLKLHSATPEQLGLPKRPCDSCPIVKTCARASNPDSVYSCPSWCAWCGDAWRIVTGRIRGERR